MKRSMQNRTEDDPAQGSASSECPAPDAAQVIADQAVERQLKISVVVAVFQGVRVLGTTLKALASSTLPRHSWELIVVDDASSDGSADTAAEFADIVVRLRGKPRGPAYARNRGAEVSRGELLIFIDADVSVHEDALEQLLALFQTTPNLSAAFGSYDDRPAARGAVSQFRNLLHHHVHQSNPGDADTFWAGCGAIRRSALLDVGMFNEWHYNRPQIEDIELGRRLRRKGHQIMLRPEIQGTHLKKWSLGDMVRADLGSRGIPWMRVLLQERALADVQSLNLTLRERLCAVGTLAAVVVLLAALMTSSSVLALTALGILSAVVVSHFSFFRLLYRRRGPVLLLTGIPLLLLYYVTAVTAAVLGYLAHVVFYEPSAALEAETEAAMNRDLWPPSPRRPLDHPWAWTHTTPGPTRGERDGNGRAA
jgi:cellulose synthase/poly-beta-1,6-N-acetylglucosamine synthase-like glycosyltransferase